MLNAGRSGLPPRPNPPFQRVHDLAAKSLIQALRRCRSRPCPPAPPPQNRHSRAHARQWRSISVKADLADIVRVMRGGTGLISDGKA